MFVVLAVSTLLGGAHAASAQAFMPTGGYTSQPIGHYELCQRHPTECGPVRDRGAVELTRELWATIVEVNNRVNTTVVPRTDLEVWGVEEYWEYPVDGTGDCDDIVLEKRRLLMEAGAPASNLLITVVRDLRGDGHAVLTVHTDQGDFVLDNLEPRVRAWKDTKYQYLKRQSSEHTGRWVSVDDSRDVLVGSIRP
nr:transglutaminase-like cysteine peptidase [Mesorhizobium alhagi]